MIKILKEKRQAFFNIFHGSSFKSLEPTCFVCSHWYVDKVDELPSIKCFVIAIALYLHSFHLCSFILHNNFLLINFFCQIFHSFQCVPHAKRTNLEEHVFTWNHKP